MSSNVQLTTRERDDILRAIRTSSQFIRLLNNPSTKKALLEFLDNLGCDPVLTQPQQQSDRPPKQYLTESQKKFAENLACSFSGESGKEIADQLKNVKLD